MPEDPDQPETGYTRFDSGDGTGATSLAPSGGAHAGPVEDQSQPADPVEKTDNTVEDVPTYPHGKLPGQEDLPTLPPVGEQRGETPIVSE